MEANFTHGHHSLSYLHCTTKQVMFSWKTWQGQSGIPVVVQGVAFSKLWPFQHLHNCTSDHGFCHHGCPHLFWCRWWSLMPHLTGNCKWWKTWFQNWRCFEGVYCLKMKHLLKRTSINHNFLVVVEKVTKSISNLPETITSRRCTVGEVDVGKELLELVTRHEMTEGFSPDILQFYTDKAGT